MCNEKGADTGWLAGFKSFLTVFQSYEDNGAGHYERLCRRDGSDEGSQHIISMRNKKNYHQILPHI